MVLMFFFAFLAGVVTILAPCIWPVLPIVLSSSIAGSGHRRPLGIVLGVMLSFTIFTLSISYLVGIFHFDPNILRVVAGAVIIFLGLSMVIPALSARLEVACSGLSNLFGQRLTGNNGVLTGFITGFSLGVVWSPCAGPILATIAALAATGQVSLSVILVTFAYVIGVGVPLFLFAWGGQWFLARAKGINRYTGRIQQVFGIIMILAAIAILTNYDQTLQLQLINKFPILGEAVNGFENSSVVTNQLNLLKNQPVAKPVDNSQLFNTNVPAPDFVGITHWLNTDKPISIKDLRGQVVLVDFWTYTCINCIRTLPFVTSWYDKYQGQGFVVIGVHTPEFQFEHDTANVLDAMKRYNIHYPVAQDNNYATWNNYQNEYWPAEYLIDTSGNIRRTHFGEGDYDKTEMAIQELLKEAGAKVAQPLVNMADQTPKGNLSPETYLGSKRMQYYYPTDSLQNGGQTFKLATPTTDSFSLGGDWTVSDEYALSGSGSSLEYNFNAEKVYIILGPTENGRSGSAKIYLDGKLITPNQAGADVKNGVVTVDSQRLYNIIDLHGQPGKHLLRLEFQSPLQAFTFTFG